MRPETTPSLHETQLHRALGDSKSCSAATDGLPLEIEKDDCLADFWTQGVESLTNNLESLRARDALSLLLLPRGCAYRITKGGIMIVPAGS